MPKSCDKCGVTMRYYTTGRGYFFAYARKQPDVMKLFAECIKMCHAEFITSRIGTPRREKYQEKLNKIYATQRDYENEKQKEFGLRDEENENQDEMIIPGSIN